MTARTTPPTVPSYVNWFVQRLLRSPLHRLMSRNTMLLSFTGRKSGKHYVIAVRYVRQGDHISCFTDSKWWKNLRGGAPVEMHIAGRAITGVATPVTDPAVVATCLSEFLHDTPADSKYYGVGRGTNGTPIPEDISAAAEYTTMVRIEPSAKVTTST